MFDPQAYGANQMDAAQAACACLCLCEGGSGSGSGSGSGVEEPVG
jgi:hypothetical protein